MSARIIPAIAVAVIAAAITWQLFLPEAAGLANNGDFPKVIARESFAPATGNYDDTWVYFVRDYQFKPEYYWNAKMYSSELTLFQITANLSRTFWHGALDIRAHGLLHLAIMLVGLMYGAAAVSKLPRGGMICVSILSVAVFADIAYTAYINSFYMDAAAMAGLILCGGAGAYLALRERVGWRTVICYGVGLCLIVASKTQHSPLVIPGVIFLPIALKGRRDFAIEMAKAVAVVAALVSSATVWTKLPDAYNLSSVAAYNTIFVKILPASPDPQADLAWFGLDPGLARFSGYHAFMPDGPIVDPEWFRAFESTTSPSSVARFWARHPVRFARTAWDDLIRFGHAFRLIDRANVSRASGLPPKTRLPSLTRWSDAKARVLWEFPAAYALLLGAAVFWGVWKVRRALATKAPCVGGAALLLLSSAIVLEFAVSTGFDSIETFRHFFIMHLLMDMLLIVLAGSLWSSARRVQAS